MTPSSLPVRSNSPSHRCLLSAELWIAVVDERVEPLLEVGRLEQAVFEFLFVGEPFVETHLRALRDRLFGGGVGTVWSVREPFGVLLDLALEFLRFDGSLDESQIGSLLGRDSAGVRGLRGQVRRRRRVW